MQQTSYCDMCRSYSCGEGFLCTKCGKEAMFVLNPDNKEGFMVDISNEGHMYFHDQEDYKFKERIIKKLLELALEKKKKKNHVDYIG